MIFWVLSGSSEGKEGREQYVSCWIYLQRAGVLQEVEFVV
ncbi:hypothetical protein APHNP_0354 [Anaplasma phagocytophilum str. ApNP]|uniref:Uncharacterized protein n=1 Tax=Anaplasma phagocytophilum str. ApNP TaxID=1359153 RepID=A0A0F3NEL3_ANAPH|nr:hypothetical protein APHNP_0354 [Anaplasma phagocytophilum str. ApNP]